MCNLLLLLVFILTSCSGILRESINLQPVVYDNLQGFSEESSAEAFAAFKKSCQGFIAKKPADTMIKIGQISFKYSMLQNVCQKIPIVGTKDTNLFFKENFTPYLLTSNRADLAHFTGYFETELEGSREKIYPYIYPIYQKPRDLDAIKPYFSRQEIDKGALNGKGLELVWVKDKIRLFFLHVQGSGKIRLIDGSTINVSYAAKNNRPYVSIGKYLVEMGAITQEKPSKTDIEEWFKGNPDRVNEVLAQNPSYIFFRQAEGPIGASGDILTSNGSLAVDNKFIPYGIPIWIETKINKNNIEFRRLLISQDTGSAIKGAMRGDIFFGSGNVAEELAGYQNSMGRYFVLLPR